MCEFGTYLALGGSDDGWALVLNLLCKPVWIPGAALQVSLGKLVELFVPLGLSDFCDFSTLDSST